MFASRRIGSPALTRAIAITLAAILFIAELTGYVLGVHAAGWGGLVRGYLPLHICGVAVYLTAFALLTRRQLIFEIAFYWGLIGTIQALLTPDVDGGPGSPWFWQFFIRHSGIVVGVLFAHLAMGMKPRRHSAWWVFGITNVWLCIVAGVNALVGSNYMYLSRAPEVTTLVAGLPWPWYIVVADVLLGVGFVCLQWLTGRRRRS